MTLTMRGDAALHVALPEAALLPGHNRAGEIIRGKASQIPTSHPPQVSEDIRGKEMLVRKNTNGFPGASILALSRSFLHVLVRDLKNRLRMADGRTQAVATGQVPFVVVRKVAGRRMVGEIVQHWRIQITSCDGSFAANARIVLPPTILSHQVAVRSTEAAARRHNASVKALPWIPESRDFHDSSQFSAIFGWKVGCQHAQRLNVVDLNRGGKRRRPIVG